MRIVFTNYTSSPTFTDPLLWLKRIEGYKEILEELSNLHEVHSIEQISYKGQLSHNGVNYHFLNLKKKKSPFPLILHRYIKKLNPQIVFIHGFLFPLQIIQLKWILPKKSIIVVQNHAEKPIGKRLGFLQKLADNYVKAYFFASFEMGEEWIKKRRIRNSYKVHQVMEASSVFFPFSKEKGMQESIDRGLVFLWVGRLDFNKDPITVIHAFRVFLLYNPLARLYMIYHTEELLGDIKNMIELHPMLKNAILLIGKVPHEQLGEWYNKAQFIISASHYEGSGVAVCEAMSCGCIPIVTNIPSFRMMTNYGQIGKLFEPGNRKQLLLALLQVKDMDLEYQREHTIEYFTKELSCKAIAGKVNRVLKSLTEMQ